MVLVSSALFKAMRCTMTARSSRLRKKLVELRNPLMAGHEMTGKGPAARGDSAAWWWAGVWSGRLACQVPDPHEIVDGGGKGEDLPTVAPVLAPDRRAVLQRVLAALVALAGKAHG